MAKDRMGPGGRRTSGVVKKSDRRHSGTSYKPFYIAIAAVVLAGVAGLGYALTRPNDDAAAIIDPAAPLPAATGQILGDTTAPVEIMEFADFQCPGCGQFATITGPDVKTRLVDTKQAYLRFMHFPLGGIHRNAWNAANAAECAGEQGRFWPMHDQIFAGQPDWSEKRNPQSLFAGYVRAIGGDVSAWESCYESRRMYPRIQATLKEGERRMISQTPSFIIGRRRLAGVRGYDHLKAYVDSARAEASIPDPAPVRR